MHEQWFNTWLCISLAFVLEELSYHTSHEICGNPLGFYNYYLACYPVIILQYAANKSQFMQHA